MSNKEKSTVDAEFYKRADAHIALSNNHINEEVHPGDSSNSLMFASARFNAWVAAAGFTNAEDMKKEKQDILDFFTGQYKLMLEENLTNYIENYDMYMGTNTENKES